MHFARLWFAYAVKEEFMSAFEATGLYKHYGEIEALRGVSASAEAGEIVGLVGDNGAGKSTFCKILSGVEQPSRGGLRVGSETVTAWSPRELARLGVGTVYQDLPFSEHVSVADNMFMGIELRRTVLFWAVRVMDRRKMFVAAKDALGTVGIKVDPTRTVADLSGGQRQAVAIARMALLKKKLVIMDEPTAALSAANRERVYDSVRSLAGSGSCVLIVGHDIKEMIEVCERLLVFRRGLLIRDVMTSETSLGNILDLMSGLGDE